MDTNELQKVNNVVKNWKDDSLKDLKDQFTKLDIKHVERSPSESPARQLLKSVMGYAFGLASRVGFKFPRHMVFVHKGVGRGGTGNRKKKEWFNPVMDEQVEKLADELAEQHAELAVNAINIK